MVEHNENEIGLHINLHSPEMALPGLQALLSKGFSVQTRVGGTLSSLLCDQLGIDPDYLKHRIQTLFLNSSPVDDVEKTTVADGDVVALSAAMPGLVGATMRKGGFYAKLRTHISHQEEDGEKKELSNGEVTIRLFNVVAKELGPRFMERGVRVDKRALEVFFKLAAPALALSEATLTMDGKEISIPARLDNDRPGQIVRLTIQVADGKPA
jgi:hypothetical protein